MSIYTPTIQGIYTARASAVRNASQTIVGRDLIDPANASSIFGTGINPEVSGLIVYLNVTAAPGIETLQLILEEQDPASLTWSVVGATLVTTTAGMVKLKVKQSILSIAASTAGIQLQDTLPYAWRIRIVHSAAGNWTYSLGIVLYN